MNNRQPGLPNFPKISQGAVIWRPCLAHVELGITPAILDLRPISSINEHGYARTDTTVEARAVWGDLDALGCPPEQHGWRVSKTSPIGMRIQIRMPVPPDWTHVVAMHFEDYPVTLPSVNGIPGVTVLRRLAKCIPHTTGRADLLKMITEYYNKQTEWESEDVRGLLDKMLDETLFNQNFDRLTAQTSVETL